MDCYAGFGLDPGVDGNTIAYADGAYTYWTDFIFQAMFAATAATIVSGAVAERIKLGSFFVFTTIYVSIIYTVAGSWKWGGGWLDGMGFYDFAGSTLVHSVGGWGALAGIIVLGPRLGKYVNGQVRAIAGHSMPLATIGVFLLWLGWFGFNGGSVLSADPGLVSLVFVTTSLAAATGIVGAMLVSWTFQHKPDLSMVLNGSLAGLVGITAGVDVVSVNAAMLIGFVAGVIVVASVLLVDRVRLDDPVGAVSVHLVCGIWGTMAVGIFSADHSFLTQAIGVLAYGAISFPAALLIFFGLKQTVGLRVSAEEEAMGLDLVESTGWKPTAASWLAARASFRAHNRNLRRWSVSHRRECRRKSMLASCPGVVRSLSAQRDGPGDGVRGGPRPSVPVAPSDRAVGLDLQSVTLRHVTSRRPAPLGLTTQPGPELLFHPWYLPVVA